MERAAAVEEARALLASRTERLGFGLEIVALQKRAGLSTWDLGEVLGEATLGDDLATADRALWHDTVLCALGLVDDLYQVVQDAELGGICCGFLRARLAGTPDRDRALAEAAELVRVWITRLTGTPILYEYFDEDRLHDFAGDLLGEVRAGWVKGGGAEPDRVLRELVAELIPRIRETAGPTLDAERLVGLAMP